MGTLKRTAHADVEVWLNPDGEIVTILSDIEERHDQVPIEDTFAPEDEAECNDCYKVSTFGELKSVMKAPTLAELKAGLCSSSQSSSQS